VVGGLCGVSLCSVGVDLGHYDCGSDCMYWWDVEMWKCGDVEMCDL
jgi:hypothetical protein